MLRSIGEQSGESVESVLRKKKRQRREGFAMCIEGIHACMNPITAHNRFLAPLSKLNSTL